MNPRWQKICTDTLRQFLILCVALVVLNVLGVDL